MCAEPPADSGTTDKNETWYDALDVIPEVIWYDASCSCSLCELNNGANSAEKRVDAEIERSLDDCNAANVTNTKTPKVLNISDRPLSDSVLYIISKGPNFALSRKIDRNVIHEVEIGIERGAFALKWKEHIEEKRKANLNAVSVTNTNPLTAFHGTTNTTHSGSEHSQTDITTTNECTTQQPENTQHATLKPRFDDTDTRMAPTASGRTEKALQILKQKVVNAYKNYRSNNRPSTSLLSNHTANDVKILKSIKEDDDLIVKRSDKCKGFVLLNKDTYIEKANQIISEYEPINKNPTRKLEASTKLIINHTLNNKLPPKIIHAIQPSCSRTAEFYGLPKNHKADIPLRPIVSTSGDPLDKLSWLLERVISQLLAFVPAHLKNTYDYLDRIHTQFPHGFPPGSIAFTIDVANLYGSIPTDEAIASTINLLERNQDKIELFGLSMTDIRLLLEHCLNNNYFRFGQKYFKQTKGIAMGSRIAPPLAIVFMNAIESMILASDKILQPLLYIRYIDDIMGIWTHEPDSLDAFLDFMNNFHPSLKFTIERSDNNDENQVPFLDTLLTVHRNGKFTTELYIKPMAANIILPYSSAHPVQTKRSVLYAQLLRAKRLGSNQPAKERGMNKIEDLFRENGYPHNMIKRTRHRITSYNTSLTTRKADNNTHISLPFIDDTLSRRVQSIVKRSKLPVRLAWKSGKTLSSYLTRSALESPPCPAGNRACHTCQAGLHGQCHTKIVVYLITCTHCPANTNTYIGETRRSIRERYMEHLRDFKNKTKNTPFGDHRHQHPNDHITPASLSVKILRVCKDVAELKIAESILIRNLKPTLNTHTSSWKLITPVQYTAV